MVRHTSYDECDCDCHRNPNMRHCGPCCQPCPKCGKNIRDLFYEDHVKECKENKPTLDFVEKLIRTKK